LQFLNFRLGKFIDSADFRPVRLDQPFQLMMAAFHGGGKRIFLS
jgi:hypothetical protein